MLKKILQSPNASNLLKILFKNQQALIIDYPNYEIVAVSESMLPDLETLGKHPEELDNQFKPHVKDFRQDLLKFRTQRITSNWLQLFKMQTFSSMSLYKVVDTPIFHNDILVGMLATYSNVTMDSLRLVNVIIKNNVKRSRLNYTITNQELSNLEKEVLFLASLGKSTKQISDIMTNLGIRDINYNTINSLISQRIYKKLDVQNLSDAILAGVETKQIASIPESLLLSKLKPYYLIDTKKDCIIL